MYKDDCNSKIYKIFYLQVPETLTQADLNKEEIYLT